MKMFHLRLCLFLCVNLFLLVNCSLPVEILCASATCSEPISKAIGSVTYASSSRNVLSFKPGQDITIISKSKNKDEYWGAIINGRKGFVPSHLVKEVRVFHKFEDLTPVLLTQNGSAEPKKTETNLPKNAETPVQVQNEKVTSLPPAVPTVPTDAGSQQPQNPEISSSETFKVIEGTTVFVDSPDQITPSATVDATPQTVISGKTGVSEERATIPPEVLKMNDNYQGQMLLKQNNLTIENEEEEEEFEDEGFDDEEDDEEDEELEEEENVINPPEEGETKETEKDLKSKTEEPVLTPQFYSATVEDETKNNAENKPDTVTVVESSVTSQVSAQVGNEPEKKMEISTETPTAPPVPEEKTEAVTESSDTPTVTPVPGEVNLKLNEVYPGLNIPAENQAQVNTDFTTPAPATGNSYTVSAESVPDNTILQNPEPNSVPSYAQNVAVPEGMPDQKNSIPVTPQTFGEQTNTPEILVNPTPDSVPNNMAPNVVPENIIPNNTPENMVISETENVPKISENPVPNTIPENPAPSVISENTIPDSVPNVNIEKEESTLDKEPQEKLELTTPFPPSVTTAFESLETNSVEMTTELNIEKEASTEDKIETATQVPVIPDQVIEEVTEVPEAQATEEGFFSQITEMFSGLFGSKKEDLLDRNEYEKMAFPEMQNAETAEEKPVVNEGRAETPKLGLVDTCQNPENDCNLFVTEEQEQSSFLPSWFPTTFDGVPSSSNTFMYLVITAVTVLLFTLGHNFIEKTGKTGPLIAKINKLEQELLVSTKECFLLKEEMQNAKEKITLYENSANDELVVSLQAEIEEFKKTKSELESQIEVLQQELDAATEAGLDLNKMLSEVLTQKGGSETLLASVENLQAQLNSQQKVIDEMTKKLGVKNEENEVLQTALDTANEKAEALEEELNNMKQNLNTHLKEKEDVTQDLKTQISQLQTRVNQLNESKEKDLARIKKNAEELQKKLKETSKGLNIKEEELKSLKDSVKQLKGKGNVNLDTLFDVSRTKAELANAEKEKQSLETKLKEEEGSKKSLEEQLKSLAAEVQNLKKIQEEAEQKKDEAEKKLEVLSTYFKEKETQLQKELGLQEALWAQKKGDEKAVYNMMKSLQEEVESYKSQNETLKKEILDQERGLKNQIAGLEQKAHENWVAARQAERKLEETKQETAQLRNRLTLVEKNTNNVDGKVIHRTSEELNGEPTSPVVMHDTSSPLLFPPALPLDPNLPPGFMPPHPMFMPPPIGGFMPPPPPPFLPGDRRPPPLGRMSSPPLNNRFSPSSPADFPFERMSSPPLSPPARNYRSPNEADRDHYRHRSPPYPPLHPRNWDDGNDISGFIPISSQRESIREHKGSNVSSGHSSSDSLDKSSRHSGRV